VVDLAESLDALADELQGYGCWIQNRENPRQNFAVDPVAANRRNASVQMLN